MWKGYDAGISLKGSVDDRFLKIFGEDVVISIKNTRSTFLSYRKRGGRRFLTIHKVFLKAPDDILKEVREWIFYKRGNTRRIREFVQGRLSDVGSKPVRKERLKIRGKHYNLGDILEEEKGRFERKMDLRITWFKGKGGRRSMTFGSYKDSLIRINSILDDPYFPRYFVSLVVYHEILHYVYPVIDGPRRTIHSKEFRDAERRHPYYERGKLFEKEFVKSGFSKKRSIWQDIASGLTSSIRKRGQIRKRVSFFPGLQKR